MEHDAASIWRLTGQKGGKLKHSAILHGLRVRGFALSLCLICATPAITAEIPSTPTKADLELASQLDAAQEQDDCSAIIKVLKPRLGKGKLYPPLELVGLELGTYCAWVEGDNALASRWANQGTALPEASDQMWRLRLLADIYQSNFTRAVETVESMQDGRGAALNSVQIRSIYALLRGLEGDKLKPERRRLLAVLTSSAYVPDEPAVSSDSFRQDFAKMLLEEGETGSAQALISEITSIDIMLDILFDHELKAMIPSPFDERAFTERELAAARLTAKNHDNSLRALLAVSGLLRKLGRFEEAMAALQTARARKGGPEGYADADENLIWWFDSMSRTHLTLGEADAAIAALQTGAAKNEHGELNVSQTINLAQLYVALKRPAEALKILEPAKSLNVSPYGAMQIRKARGCAAAQTGDRALASADLAFATEHRTDAAMAHISLLLCTGDRDGAAAAIIARLEDEEKRDVTLAYLADYDAPPPPLSDDPGYRDFQAVKARTDVAAAVQRAGGSRRIRLQDASW